MVCLRQGRGYVHCYFDIPDCMISTKLYVLIAHTQIHTPVVLHLLIGLFANRMWIGTGTDMRTQYLPTHLPVRN